MGPHRPTDRRRWIALVVLCAGFLMIILDQTIVNVALPTIQSNLHFSQSALAWVVNAYLIAFGGLLLLVGRLGDLIGRRRIFLAGLTVFTTASMVCGLADSQALLIGARFVQGVGGAMTSAVILGIIVTMFPTPASRPGRSASTASSPLRAARSGCSPAASSPRRSTGTGSSSSTCRSASLPACSPRGCCRRTPASACDAGRTRRARYCSSRPSCSACTRSSRPATTAGDRRTRSGSAVSRSRSSPGSWCARRSPRTR